jgi:hypothetical protein
MVGGQRGQLPAGEGAHPAGLHRTRPGDHLLAGGDQIDQVTVRQPRRVDALKGRHQCW